MLVRKGVRIAASIGIAALTGIYVDLDTILGFEDLADLADVIDTSNFSFDSDIDYIDWETEPDLILSENDFTPEAYAGLEDQYNVSFGAQKESLQRSGGGLGSLDVTITKEPGSSNLFCITDGRHTIHDVPGGTKTIEISGITYKLPKLKG